MMGAWGWCCDGVIVGSVLVVAFLRAVASEASRSSWFVLIYAAQEAA